MHLLALIPRQPLIYKNGHFWLQKKEKKKTQTVKVKALKWDCTQRMGGVMAVSSIFSYPICLFVR